MAPQSPCAHRVAVHATRLAPPWQRTVSEVLRFAGRRLLGAIPLLFGILTILFLILHLAPGDPLPPCGFDSRVSEEALAHWRVYQPDAGDILGAVALRRRFRLEEFPGMRFESDQGCRQVHGSRALRQLAQHRLVAEMHAVETAYRGCATTMFRPQIV